MHAVQIAITYVYSSQANAVCPSGTPQ